MSSVHLLCYIKRRIGQGRVAHQKLSATAEQSLLQPCGHGTGQRWLYDLVVNNKEVVIWLFTLIRHGDSCLPPSLDARIKVKAVFGRHGDYASMPNYCRYLLDSYEYAFVADQAGSWYLPWNDASAIINHAIDHCAFPVLSPGVQPFEQYRASLYAFRSARYVKQDAVNELERFAEKACAMPRAFISYRRRDASVFAMQVVTGLYRQGIAVWWDQWAMPRTVSEERSMLSNDYMCKTLNTAIVQSKYAVSIMTDGYASDKSPWTRFEFESISKAASQGLLEAIMLKPDESVLFAKSD